MKSYLQIIMTVFVISLLNGCHLTQQNNSTSKGEQSQSIETIKLPPQMRTTDWNSILSPMVLALGENVEIDENNTLLVSYIKNNSDQYVSPTQLNKTLFDLLNQQQRFHLLDKKTINLAKRNLGIPYDDSSVSRTKMISLARQVNADYLLFMTINQTPISSEIEADISLELLLTKTGEIIWQFEPELPEDEDSNESMELQ